MQSVYRPYMYLQVYCYLNVSLVINSDLDTALIIDFAGSFVILILFIIATIVIVIQYGHYTFILAFKLFNFVDTKCT